MKLRYLGTGTVLIDGVGEVSSGHEIEVPEEVGRALASESPSTWKEADARGRPQKKSGGD